MKFEESWPGGEVGLCHRGATLLVESLIVLGVAGAVGVSCKSGPQVDPFEVADETPGDPLDSEAEPDPTARTKTSWDEPMELSLEEPPEELAREIDGSLGDWEESAFKDFADEEYVTTGESFWEGAGDAAVSVAAEADRGHLYMVIEVEDETVLEGGSPEELLDGVVLHLRDPKLAGLSEELPSAVAEGGFRSDLSIFFRPDGEFWAYDESRRDLYREGIRTATVRTAKGYRVEIAMRVETLRRVAKIPMPEVAFRVEILDTDDPDRTGNRTRLSTHPPAEGAGERFATLEMKGWLPYESITKAPPRTDAIGRWRLTEEGWRFETLEKAPYRWRHLEEAGSVRENLEQGGGFEEICDPKRRERVVLDAYESRSEEERAVLVACGERADEESCPDDATTRLHFVELAAHGAGWRVHESRPVRPEPLEQCIESAPSGRALHSGFSMRPLEAIFTSVWAVGWRAERNTGTGRFERRGIWLLHVDGDGAALAGSVETDRRESTRSARTVASTRVHLVPVDENPGHDICAIRRTTEQRCRGLDRKCRPRDRGTSVTAHIQMWKPKARSFEPFFVSKHRRCDASFQFGERKAYLLYQRKDRIGVVQSPAYDP